MVKFFMALRFGEVIRSSETGIESIIFFVTAKRNSALSDGAEKSPKPNGDIFARHHAPPPPRFSESEPVTPTTIHVPKELMRRYGHLEKGVSDNVDANSPKIASGKYSSR